MAAKGPIARFVLRLPRRLHGELTARARSAGLSLNRWCEAAIRSSLHPATAPQGLGQGTMSDVVSAGARLFGDDLIGVVLFGSAARGDARAESDIDLLIVLKDARPIVRSLYRTWDAESGLDEIYSPQFVHLPADPRQAGGLWLEVAQEGIVLAERDLAISRTLARLRRFIGSGEIRRFTADGQPYWVRTQANEDANAE